MKKVFVAILMLLLTAMLVTADVDERLIGSWLASGEIVYMETAFSFSEEIQQDAGGVDMGLLGLSEIGFVFNGDSTLVHSLKYLGGNTIWGEYTCQIQEEGWGLKATANAGYDEAPAQFDLYYFLADEDNAVFVYSLLQQEYASCLALVLHAKRQK